MLSDRFFINPTPYTLRILEQVANQGPLEIASLGAGLAL
jgi:hypothetical protein